MFTVWNDTDGIPAAPNPFETREAAEEYVSALRQRFAWQGYYAAASGERVAPEDVAFRIEEVVALRDEIREVLASYAEREGCAIRDAIRDALVDLRHLADAEGVDFHRALDGSYEVYCEEKMS